MYLPSTIVSPPEVGGGRRWEGWKEGGREEGRDEEGREGGRKGGREKERREKGRERERKEKEQGRDGGRERRRDTVREGGTKVNVSEQLKSGVHLTYSAYLHSACTPAPLEYGTCTREKKNVITSRDHTQLKVMLLTCRGWNR